MKAKAPGFSMVELVLVIAMMGILIAVMMPTFRGAMNRVRRFATERTIDKIEFALNQYSIDMGGFPGSREGGLNTLVSRPEGRAYDDWKGPYLEGVKMVEGSEGGVEVADSWGRSIEYSSPPVNFPNKYRKYELISYGPNEDDPGGYIQRGQ